MLLTFFTPIKIEEPNDIIPRAVWKAEPPRYSNKLRIPVSNVILSYFSSRYTCYGKVYCKRVMRDVQRRNFRDEMDDILYNFMIGGNGMVYEGRGWSTSVPAPGKYTPLTSKCISIGFIGDYSNEHPSPAMIKSALKLIEFGIQRNIITPKYDLVTYRANY